MHSQPPAARNCRYGHSSLHCNDFSLLPFWSLTIFGREGTDWPHLKRITVCAFIFDIKSILKLLHSSKKLMLVIECRHSFNFYSWLVAREISDLTAYMAHTLNKLRPLLIHEIIPAKLERNFLFLCQLTMFCTSRDHTSSFCSIPPEYWGQFVLCYFFSKFLSTTFLVLPKNDWNTEDKMQSNSTFVVSGIYQTLCSFLVITSNQRSPVTVLGFRNIL